MLRKVEKEIPQELSGLKASEANKPIVIGDSYYEMCPMGYKDLSDSQEILTDIMNTVTNEPEKDVVDSVVNSGLIHKILEAVGGIEGEDLDKMTVPQMFHAAGTWFDLNFFSLPTATQEALLRIFDYLISTLLSPTPSEEDLEQTPEEVKTKETDSTE